ncbi:MAG: hypothetical protein ABFD83_08000 [Armatimonadota bacterium]
MLHLNRKLMLFAAGIVLLAACPTAGTAKDLMTDGEPGAWCRIDFGLPYYFENVGTGPLTVSYDPATKKYNVQGKAKILPVGKVKTDEAFSLPISEGDIARHIASTKTLDWGSLPESEVQRAKENLKFCQAVAQFEAKQPVTDWETEDGEPARLLFRTDGSMKGSWGAFGSDLRFEYVGPGAVKMLQLKPSGRFKVYGTVRSQKTDQICKNGWIDKEGRVTSTE